MEINELSGKVIQSAIEVHKQLGPGLLEAVYQQCLGYELADHGLYVEKEVSLPIRYKKLSFESVYRMDLLVNRKLVVELKR